MTNNTTMTTAQTILDMIRKIEEPDGTAPEHEYIKDTSDPILKFRSDPWYTILCQTLEDDYSCVFGDNYVHQDTGRLTETGKDIVEVTELSNPFCPEMLELELDGDPELIAVQQEADEIREYFMNYIAVQRAMGEILTDWQRAVVKVLQSNNDIYRPASRLITLNSLLSCMLSDTCCAIREEISEISFSSATC